MSKMFKTASALSLIIFYSYLVKCRPIFKRKELSGFFLTCLLRNQRGCHKKKRDHLAWQTWLQILLIFYLVGIIFSYFLAFSSPEATILLVSTKILGADQKDRGLWGREWLSCRFEAFSVTPHVRNITWRNLTKELFDTIKKENWYFGASRATQIVIFSMHATCRQNVIMHDGEGQGGWPFSFVFAPDIWEINIFSLSKYWKKPKFWDKKNCWYHCKMTVKQVNGLKKYTSLALLWVSYGGP